ncbi:MAG: AlpA family phage regulatory protein [Alphaproteobacteria bacterium]|jgi:predicted DNA-binding transcriptional regulator AlpA|nr:AlpA family phage regulatory protein [Alphaproteobacteria bacterium]MDP7223357.1 AlpA family phage regulatory protein [Alphaproteobacteria bacterium]
MNGNQRTLLTRSDLAEMGISYSNSHLLKLEKDELFPKRIYLSAQKVCWDLTEVNDWLGTQRARRGGVHHG